MSCLVVLNDLCAKIVDNNMVYCDNICRNYVLLHYGSKHSYTMEVKVKVPEPYKVLFGLPDETRLVIVMGGRGSGKTYIVTLWGTFEVTIKDKRVQVLRDEKSQVQASIMNEFFLRYDKVNKDGVFDGKFTKQFDGIKNNKTNEKVLFSSGFRASTTDKKANLKGVSNVDIGIVEEGEDVRNENLFNMWTDSVRNEGSIIVFICNTPDIHHFIVHRYFNYFPVTQEDEPKIDPKYLDGYYKLVPKGVKGVQTIFTTHEDNPHLPAVVRENYLNYGNPESHLWNPHYYLTAIRGYSTTGLSGQVFKFYELMDDEAYQALPYDEVIGIDFGTASPAGIVGVKLHKGDMWVRELNYSPLTLIDMGKKLCELGFDEDTLAIADCAEPATIRDLRFGLSHLLDERDRANYPALVNGFRNLRASPDKRISEGIDTILSLRLHVTRSSANLLKELTMYTWATDRDGKPTGKPVDAYNHCFVGHTMIDYEYGQKPIYVIERGDMVMTRYGLRRVVHKFHNGRMEVRKYRLIFDGWEEILKCTADHKILTEEMGWVEIGKLMSGLTLYNGRSLEESSSTCTEEKSITQKVGKGFMSLFGKATTERLRKGITSIIKMVTGVTTRFGILNVSKGVSTCHNICQEGIKTNSAERWIMPESLRASGTEAKPVSNYTQNLHGDSGRIGKQEYTGASGVIRSTEPSTEESRSFVIRTARLKHLEVGESYYDDVFDLMVEDVHEYFAEGLLVHNCIDPMRYVVQYYGRLY